MKSLAMPDPEPTTPRRERPADARSICELPYRFIALAATAAALFWITGQPPQVSADILRVLLLMAMGALGATVIKELVADLCGRDGMEMLETAGTWVATALASLVYLLLMVGVLTVLWYFAGPAILRVLGLFGLNF